MRTGSVAAGRPRIDWAVPVMLAPAVAFLLACFIVPVGYVLVLSVTDPTLSLAHFRRILAVPVYLKVMAHTFSTSLVVTVCCLALGYPFAYAMARRHDILSRILLAIVAMCFWTGFVVRTYAWMVILGNKGVMVALFAVLGIGPSPQLLFTSFASTVGMAHILLPFMIMALYAVMRRIDASHLRAAYSLGAPPGRAFVEIYLPLTLPGVVGGCVLVFTLCLGFYVTPMLLGSPNDMMLSQLISQQIDELLAWGMAAALATMLLVVTLALLAAFNRVAGLDRLWG